MNINVTLALRAFSAVAVFGLTLPCQATIEAVPPSVTVDLSPGASVTRTIRVCLPGSTPAASQVDVYILADTTGSMGTVLNAVKASASDVVSALLGSGTDLRVGIGNYKDFPFDPYCFQNQLSPSNVLATITTAISAWSASGGNDGPEGQLFALYQLATSPAIGWRPAAKRIIVWFGDAPGHDPVCSAISGLPISINEATVTSALQAAGPGGTSVIAIGTSTGFAGSLNANPGSAQDYSAFCGASTTGTAGQATRIAAATGGLDTTIGPSSAIVGAILASVGTVLQEVDISLAVAGNLLPFVSDIQPPVHQDVIIPSDPTQEICVDFQVTFTGLPCSPVNVFPGSFTALSDGASTGAVLPYSVTQALCGLPTCSIVGAPAMGSVGVPISFTVSALDGDPSDSVTLNGSLPFGAVANPPLPLTGNSVSTTITWVPNAAQLGSFSFDFTVVDGVGNTSACSTSIDIAECYLLFGFAPLAVNVGDAGDVLYVDYVAIAPVTLDNIPEVQIPNNPTLTGLHLYAQVAMLNGVFSPTDPLNLTQGLDITVGGGVPTQYGTTNSMQIWSNHPTPLGGRVVVRFTLP